MNPGILTLLIIAIALILIASGWKDILVGNISRLSITLFFCGWFLFAYWDIRILSAVRMNGSLIFLAATTAVILYRVRPWAYKLQMISIGFLLGALLFLCKQLLTIGPSLTVYGPLVDQALVVTLITAIFLRHPLMQIACVSIGAVTGELLFTLPRDHTSLTTIFGSAFHDLWWLSVFAVRAVSVVMASCASFVRAFFRQ